MTVYQYAHLGKYIFIIDFIGEWVERSYTPVLPLDGSQCNEGSEVKLMVKLYSKGAMSSILSSLNVGMKSTASYPFCLGTTQPHALCCLQHPV